jgi:hypothetical protein
MTPLILLTIAALSAQATGIESVSHLLLDCPKYESVRGELWRRLEDEMAPDCWHMMQQMQNEEKAYKLLDFDFLGGSCLLILLPLMCMLAGRSVGSKVRNQEVRERERETTQAVTPA